MIHAPIAAPPDVQHNINLHYAATIGDVALIENSLNAGADIDLADISGRTPLHKAADGGHAGAIKLLLRSKAKITATERSYDRTPLHLAAESGHVAAIEALVVGTDVNVTDYFGNTPLHLAAKNGHVGAIKALIKAGANVKASGNLGATPLHVAAKERHVAAIEALLEAGADANALDELGTTPSQCALEDGYHPSVKAVLNALTTLTPSYEMHMIRTVASHVDDQKPPTNLCQIDKNVSYER